MGKIKVWIAALIIAGTVSIAGAEVAPVNFDTGSLAGHSAELVAIALAETNGDDPVKSRAANNTKAAKTIAAKLKAANDNVLEQRLDGSILSGIAFSQANEMNLVKRNLKSLLRVGTIREKLAFAHNSKKTYKFPNRLNPDAPQAKFQLTAGGCGPCNSWHTERSCYNRQVCRVACVAVGGAAGASVAGSAGAVGVVAGVRQICREVCESVPECSNVQVCDGWKGCW